jgi:N-carbamoylputrescine amidase
VGICFDNHTYAVAQAIAHSDIDLMLMPHSYCTPTQPTRTIGQADIDRLNENPLRVARLYNNEWLGVPVALINKSGAWDSPVPHTLLGQPLGYCFSGRSMILDADGSVRAQMGDEEGVAVADVYLDPTCKKHSQPPHYSRYIYPGPIGREILRVNEWAGANHYRASALRKSMAAQHKTTQPTGGLHPSITSVGSNIPQR